VAPVSRRIRSVTSNHGEHRPGPVGHLVGRSQHDDTGGVVAVPRGPDQHVFDQFIRPGAARAGTSTSIGRTWTELSIKRAAHSRGPACSGDPGPTR
jgi:hypothetical protein